MAPLSYFHRTVEWIKTCSHRPTDTFVRLILILQFFPTFNTIVLSSDVDALQSWWLILCLVSRVSQVMEPAWRVYSGIQSCLCHLELSNKSKHTQEDEAEGVRPYQQDVSILYYVICVGTCRQDFKHLPAFMIRDKRLGDEKIHRNSRWNLLCLQKCEQAVTDTRRMEERWTSLYRISETFYLFPGRKKKKDHFSCLSWCRCIFSICGKKSLSEVSEIKCGNNFGLVSSTGTHPPPMLTSASVSYHPPHRGGSLGRLVQRWLDSCHHSCCNSAQIHKTHS